MATDAVNRAKHCGQCNNVIAKPEKLPCDHLFCTTCIDEIVSLANGVQTNLKCPKCTIEFTIPLNSGTDQRGYIREKYIGNTRKVREINCSGRIKGVAILGDELFAISSRTPIMLKFDVSPDGREFPVELSISGLLVPQGIAANEKLSCLYIVDWKETFGGCLWRYRYRKGSDTVQEKPIQTFEGRPRGITVSPDGEKLLITCSFTLGKTASIVIYRLERNEVAFLHSVELPDIVRPHHAVVTPTKKYIIGHGWRFFDNQGLTSYQEDNNESISERLSVFYGKKGGGQGDEDLDRPVSLALDEDGLVLVVNQNNHRIELMTEDLGLIRHLATQKVGILYPRCVCQHNGRGLMFVGQAEKILVLQVREINPVPENDPK